MTKPTEEARNEPWQFIQSFWPPNATECLTAPEEPGQQGAFTQGCCPCPSALVQAAAQLPGGNGLLGQAPLVSRKAL